MSNNTGRYKYLAKNIGLLTLGSFATKLLSFFLVPLYTNILTTTEYGINDLFVTVVSILVPVLTIDIQSAVMRFPMDREYDNNDILKIGIKFQIYGIFIVCFGLLINHIFRIYDVFLDYEMYFLAMYVMHAFIQLLLAYVRGIDKISILSLSGVIGSATGIFLNILFLAVFRLGLIGYFWASIIGSFVQCLFLISRVNILKAIKIYHVNRMLEKEMIAYSRPLVANAVAWWVNNAADRFVVIFFRGFDENGIYSVAAKIPSILNVFQTIFSQAWTLSAVKDFDPEDKDGFFANMYSMYNCMMTIGCSVIILADKLLAKILYAKDFYLAWQYVPWLTIAIVFGSMSGYIGGLFSAVKDSKIFGRSTMIGAAVNIGLNIVMTPLLGAMGAAIATSISYISVWAMRFFHSRKYIKLKINLSRDLACYVILIIQSIVLLLMSDPYLFMIEVALFGTVLVLFYKEIQVVILKFKKTY